MKNIITNYFIILSVITFCYGQNTSNISLGIDEFLLKKSSNDYIGKRLCLFTNSGAVNKDRFTSVEILKNKFESCKNG